MQIYFENQHGQIKLVETCQGQMAGQIVPAWSFAGRIIYDRHHLESLAAMVNGKIVELTANQVTDRVLAQAAPISYKVGRHG